MQLKLFKQQARGGESVVSAAAEASPEQGKGGDGRGGGSAREAAAAILYGDICEMVAKKIRCG